MNLNINLDSLQQHCRICLQKADINIFHYKVDVKTSTDIQENLILEEADDTEKSVFDLLKIFNNANDLLNLCNEFPSVCWQCLEDLKCCYMFYEKLMLTTNQLKNLYEETLNQSLQEEHLIEIIDEKEYLQEIKELAVIENNAVEQEEYITEVSTTSVNPDSRIYMKNKTSSLKNIPLNKNDAFIITQFVASAVDAGERISSTQKLDDNDDSPSTQQPQQILTVNLKAVEVKDFQNLDNLQMTSTHEEPAVYVCQYCPQAFANCDYLKTHIHKSHVCKFCTQAFSITEELFKHIREIHTEHKCAICHKHLSSHTNLRHHIRRVHHIKLPAKVTLLDFIKSSESEEIMANNQEEFSQEEIEAGELEANIQYILKNNDCIEVFTKDLDEEMN